VWLACPLFTAWLLGVDPGVLGFEGARNAIVPCSASFYSCVFCASVCVSVASNGRLLV
jgi:hypothetical protein